MNTTTCKIGGSPPEYSMQELTKFHGHLGPYIVLGYRMGRARPDLFPAPRKSQRWFIAPILHQSHVWLTESRLEAVLSGVGKSDRYEEQA